MKQKTGYFFRNSSKNLPKNSKTQRERTDQENKAEEYSESTIPIEISDLRLLTHLATLLVTV